MLKKNNKLVLNLLITLLLGVAVVFYWNILSTVIAGIILAFILNPAVSYIQSYGVNRTLSIILVYAMIFLSFIIALIFVVPKVASQGESIFTYLNTSQVVQKAMKGDIIEDETANKSSAKEINIYLHYDDEQKKIVVNEEGDLIPQVKESPELEPLPQVQDVGPVMTYADSISQQSIKKFMEIPILSEITDYVNYLDEEITFINIREELKNLTHNLKAKLIQAPEVLVSNISRIASTFAFVFMIPFISFFILKDKNLFAKMFNRFIPNRFFELYITITHKISDLVSSFLRALVVEILIVGVLTAITLTIIGVNYAVLIGLLAGFANMVPYFGPFFGVVFAISSVVLTGQDLSMILYVIFGMWGVQIIDNNIVYPIVIGKSTNIHPLYVFLTVVAGGYMFGVIGMIISVPIVYIVSEISKELYSSLKKYDII
ncbi:AI-2E family transporter [bacterium]|nr:AI-2E family transporter [bacterium]